MSGGRVLQGQGATLSDTDPYSWADKALHRLAFWPPMRRVAERAEAGRFAETLASVSAVQPVWIAGLPRAGSTALLNLLSTSPALASPRYCDMPFITAPLLWAKVSGRSRGARAFAPRERAHGDGIAVTPESPEAFEEPLWVNAWPDHFGDTAITLWDASEPMPEHFRAAHQLWLDAIGLVRGGQRRVILKNNTAIARLPFLHRHWPDAPILVPFREPGAQAASLLYQHRHALTRQRTSRFARAYMDDLGHFEFGGGLKAIAFPGFDPSVTGSSDTFDYWLKYWTAAYAHILAVLPPNARLFDYDAACARPHIVPTALTRLLDAEILQPLAPPFAVRAREERRVSREASAVHAALRAHSSNLLG